MLALALAPALALSSALAAEVLRLGLGPLTAVLVALPWGVASALLRRG